ncbi:MAG: hypothetical protein ACJAQT_002216 [Akkermansiaceae bacterium]|jgi:hypothetical protein
MSLFQTLADLYRKSPLRQRDFTIDYEKFLRLAKVADGDERELAEKELRLAVVESGGALTIDRAKKSELPERIRVALEGGETWLFSKCGGIAPTSEREELASFFKHAACRTVPEKWITAWKEWCEALASRASAGASVQPFSKTENDELLDALAGVLNWQGDSLIRYASAQICGDSKRLQALEGRLAKALSEITGEVSLEAFGIFHKPRSVMFHGPLVLKSGEETTDFSSLPGPITLSETNLIQATLSTPASICLTVENEDVFVELAKRNPGIFLIQTSFPGSAVRGLIGALPEMTFLHFGDSDPAGFDILRDLREKTGRDFLPLLMDHRPSPQPIPLSPKEKETLDRLSANPLLEDLHGELLKILESGDKGMFEQELVPVEQVLATLCESAVRLNLVLRAHHEIT